MKIAWIFAGASSSVMMLPRITTFLEGVVSPSVQNWMMSR